MAKATETPVTETPEMSGPSGQKTYEQLTEIANAAIKLFDAGIPTQTSEQRDAVNELHTLLFGG